MASEALYLADSPLPSVKLHPTAVMSILNNFARRGDRNSRVIGTLLGVVREGNVEVTDCFAVPHTEKTDEVYVAINKDYHKSMYTARRHVNRREQIVGWYATTTTGGEVIVDNSSHIHGFYTSECSDPIHLVVDTTLSGDNMGIKAYISESMTSGTHQFASMFHEIRVEIELAPSEVSCLNHMTKGQKYLSTPWSSSSIIANVPSEADMLRESAERLVAVIDKIADYVNAVVDGKQIGQADIGMALADTLSSVQSVNLDGLHSVLQGKTQDLLMVNYIATLIQTQLAIAEKLNEII